MNTDNQLLIKIAKQEIIDIYTILHSFETKGEATDKIAYVKQKLLSFLVSQDSLPEGGSDAK